MHVVTSSNYRNNISNFPSHKNSFQSFVDRYRPSTASNFTDFLKSKWFLLDHMYCHSSDNNFQFEKASENHEKVTAIYTIEWQKIYIIATRIPSIKKQVAKTLNFISEKKHFHC